MDSEDFGEYQAESTREPYGEWAEGDSLVDSDGTVFDPAVHAYNNDGNPKYTPKGRFRRKPGTGRKDGKKSGVDPNKAKVAEPGQLTPEEAANQGPRMAAVATVDWMGNLGQLVGGDEWQFVQHLNEDGSVAYDERRFGIDAFERYYREKGMTDLPPGVMVGMFLASYVGVRLVQGPQTRSRVKKLWDRVRGWSAKKSRSRSASQQAAEEEAS